MTFTEYQQYFQEILNQTNPPAPYDNPDYFNYAKLNQSRMNRWLKTGRLNQEIKAVLSGITKVQQWIVITEPWCGDAAHIVPFMEMMAKENVLINIRYELRDSEPFRIDNYLTNGKSKSIPKIIIRDNEGNDLAVWGPRPKKCQVLHDELVSKNANFETMKIELQQWYNHDEGKEIMDEFATMLSHLKH